MMKFESCKQTSTKWTDGQTDDRRLVFLELLFGAKNIRGQPKVKKNCLNLFLMKASQMVRKGSNDGQVVR